MQQPERRKCREDVCEHHGRPEETEPDGQLVGFIEVRQIQDDVRNKATLQQPENDPHNEKRRSAVQEELAGCGNGPEDHLHRNPAVRADPFAQQLRRHFGAEEGESKEGISDVVV